VIQAAMRERRPRTRSDPQSCARVGRRLETAGYCRDWASIGRVAGGLPTWIPLPTWACEACANCVLERVLWTAINLPV